MSVKLLDAPPVELGRDYAVLQGIRLFNEERFWECHEILETVWHKSRGAERDLIQGLILTAAGFVHYQKDEQDTCLSILARARAKLSGGERLDPLDVSRLIMRLDRILTSHRVRLFKLQTNRN